MNRHDYAFLLDTVFRTWSRYEAMCLLYADRMVEDEPSLAAQLALVRTHRDRALLDLTTLRAQADDIVQGRPIQGAIPSTPRPWAPLVSPALQFTVAGSGGLDATL